MSLLLINGPPGVGKSTLARRYAADRPLCLVLDVDLVRAMLSAWSVDATASGLAARDLALAMTRTHLAAGYEVVVPQLLPRRAFAEQLQELGATEVMLWCSLPEALRRFRRRASLDPAAPQDEDVAVASWYTSLHHLDVPHVASATDDVEATYTNLLAVLHRTGPLRRDRR